MLAAYHSCNPRALIRPLLQPARPARANGHALARLTDRPRRSALRPGAYRFDRWCRWGPVCEGDVWQVMMRLNDGEVAEAGRRAGAGEVAEAVGRAAQATAAKKGKLALGAAAASRVGCVDRDATGSSDADATTTTVTITLSHFLPHPALPFCRHTPELAKAVGCPQLQHLLRRLGAAVHVYGHTHVEYDGELRDRGGQGLAGAAPGARQMSAAAVDGLPGESCDMGGQKVSGERASGAAGAGRESGPAACGVAGGVAEGSSRRYVHRALHGRDRVVLRCVWDGGRGLCGYDVEGEGEGEEGEVDRAG